MAKNFIKYIIFMQHKNIFRCFSLNMSHFNGSTVPTRVALILHEIALALAVEYEQFANDTKHSQRENALPCTLYYTIIFMIYKHLRISLTPFCSQFYKEFLNSKLLFLLMMIMMIVTIIAHLSYVWYINANSTKEVVAAAAMYIDRGEKETANRKITQSSKWKH
jgi:hypothetical protein